MKKDLKDLANKRKELKNNKTTENKTKENLSWLNSFFAWLNMKTTEKIIKSVESKNKEK